MQGRCRERLEKPCHAQHGQPGEAGGARRRLWTLCACLQTLQLSIVPSEAYRALVHGPLPNEKQSDFMVQEQTQNGMEQLTCATCRQPAKLQCPRW